MKKQYKHHNPPRLAAWILKSIYKHNGYSTRLGDFWELYNEIIQQHNIFIGWLWYWNQTLKSVFLRMTNVLLWSLTMSENYLLITFRTLIKNKSFSIINIFGLALSISICLMIIIFIKDKKNSDKFHENKDRIVRVYTTDEKLSWDINGWAPTPGSLGPYLLSNYSFIEETVRLRHMWGNVLNTGMAIPVGGLYAEPSFLRIFSFSLKDGDPETALNDPYSIIISEQTASRIFGDVNPMNKSLTIEKLGDFTVTGILKEMEEKSHFMFNVLVSFSTAVSLEKTGAFKTDMNSWSSFPRYYTYVLLKNKNDLSDFKRQLPQIESFIIPEPEIERFGFKLQQLLDISLGINLSNSMPRENPRLDVVFVPFLALIVIFLACFNYIILSIARSLKRTREIGLRKVIGSRRSQIIKLFLSETFIVTFLALVTACLLILLLIPLYNRIDAVENTGMQINLEMMKDPGIYIIFILLAVGVSFVAGLYPALYLSSFQPKNALQGVSKIKGLSHLLTRKIMMGIQFGVSLISIIFIVYFFQIHKYWMSYDRGIETKNKVCVYLGDLNYETFRNELMKNSFITGVSFSNERPVYGGGGNLIKLITGETEEPKYANSYSVDPEFIRNFNIELIAGRNFSGRFSTDIDKTIILNEKAVQSLNLGPPEEAVGKTFSVSPVRNNPAVGELTNVTVIGVVKDFNFRWSYEHSVAPFALRYLPREYRYGNIGYSNINKDAVKSYITDTWKRLDKVHPLFYTFFNDEQAELDSNMSGTLKISAWGSGFVILIALFGLLGMATYTTEMRVKEVGIRKAMGAGAFRITYLLSKDYIKLILFSAAFALPGGYFLTDLVMQFFAVRPDMSIWVLPAVLAFILFLALITIGSQTVKAALSNPVDSIREE